MKPPLKRLLLSFGLAFALPFPGPHIDDYIPLAWVLLHGDLASADRGFFILYGAVLVFYAAAIFGVMTLAIFLSRRNSSR